VRKPDVLDVALVRHAQLLHDRPRRGIAVDGERDHVVELEHVEGHAHRLASHLGRVAAVPVVGVDEPQQLDLGTIGDRRVLHPGVPDDLAAGQQDRPYAEAPALPVLDELLERGARMIGGALVRWPQLLRRAGIAVETDVGVGVAGLRPAADQASGRHVIYANGARHQRSPVPRVGATCGMDPPMVV